MTSNGTAFKIPGNLDELSKEELIEILKRIQNSDSEHNAKGEDAKKGKQPFDFKKYKKRHIALKFLYLGWDYAGFASQNHTDKTIEAQLFNALEKTKLMESRESSNFHRCGRTDKGVSAFSQVVSLDLRSNLLEGKGIITPEDYNQGGRKEADHEIDYPGILNRVLPPEIKIIAWAPVNPSFSARFDCTQRTYKYWFPIGNLNIERMHKAGQSLIGEHDFRNFCKMDVANGVVNYKRRIVDVAVKPMTESATGGYDMAELTVVGQAFLYHQIRCIISVLFLVGQGKEDIDVIEKLLNINDHPRKPQYTMASETPLVLFDCTFGDVEWIYDKKSIKVVIEHLQNTWTVNSIKTTIIKQMLSSLEGTYSCMCDEAILNHVECLQPGGKSRVYKRLLERHTCESLEQKIEHYSKKAKRDKY